MPISKVVGEGTYGCVHEPSLECAESGINYKNKVSKILLDKYATQEMDEYLAIQRADPENQFFLGVPLRCKPKQTVSNYNGVKKCSKGSMAVNTDNKTILPNFDLLILENGGMNLQDFAKSMEYKPATPENQKIMENFWIECHRLFLGLSVFLKENIVHHDLKAQNVVYNPKMNRAAFIDFGLMRPLNVAKSNIFNHQGRVANLIHWSYPVETTFYYNGFFSSNSLKKGLHDQLHEGLDSVFEISFLNNVLPKNNGRDSNDLKRSDVALKLYQDYIALLNSMDRFKFEDFVDESMDTFDLYGLSMGLMYVLVRTYRILKDSNSKIDYNSIFMVLWNSFRPDLNNRYTVIQALHAYEEIVLSNRLKDDHIIFINHIPTKIAPPPHLLDVPKMSDAALEETMEKDDEKLLKKICPEGKVLNPFTGRCVLECKEGQQRDEKFHCKTVKKTKASKASKTQKEKTCSESKDLNPTTGRCVKKCKPGQSRDEKFHCKTAKSTKYIKKPLYQAPTSLSM